MRRLKILLEARKTPNGVSLNCIDVEVCHLDGFGVREMVM